MLLASDSSRRRLDRRPNVFGLRRYRNRNQRRLRPEPTISTGNQIEIHILPASTILVEQVGVSWGTPRAPLNASFPKNMCPTLVNRTRL